MEGRDEWEGCRGEMKGRDGGEREEGREGESEGEKERETWIGTSHFSPLREGNLVVTQKGVGCLTTISVATWN